MQPTDDSLPLVSIITIVYNGEKYIENAIRSVLAQTYQPVEYIIVDGGSADGTISVIKKYESSLAHWISEKDRGISDAFNKGLRLAKGEIIGILNADDWYEPDAIARAVEGMKGTEGTEGEGRTEGMGRMEGEGGTEGTEGMGRTGEAVDIVYGDLRLWKNGKKDFVLKGDHRYLEKEMTVNHPTLFVRKRCYEQFGLFDESFRCAMDYDLLLRFWVSGCRFAHVPFVLTNMRWEGFSDTRWLLGCRETLLIKNKYLPSRRLANRLYYYKHVAAIGLPKWFERAGLGFAVRLYRSWFSRVKKVYE